MAEKVSAEPGALLKVAGPKGLTSLTAISKSTGKDRKTLKAINDGLPVKQSTLEALATQLRVPPEHFLKTDAQGAEEEIPFGSPRLRELSLEPLNAKRLRELLEKMARNSGAQGDIKWQLNIEDITDEIKSQLVKFKDCLNEWKLMLNGWAQWRDRNQDLEAQLAKIKMAKEIEICIKQIVDENLKLFGATFLWWKRGDYRGSEHFFPNARMYEFVSNVIIAIEPKSATTSKALIDAGQEPPRSFKYIPSGINDVYVDFTIVWTRPDDQFDDEIPF